MLEQFDFSIEKVKREVFYVGEMYSEESPWVYKMFHIESEKELLKELSDDIFKATVERKDIGDVKFIEILYDVREEEDR